jgi:hypothetical protein
MALRRKSHCSPAEHKKATAHRKAEAKWVAKNKERHNAAAKAYYHRNKTKVKAQRKIAATTKHRAQIRAAKRAYGGSSRGRPREC